MCAPGLSELLVPRTGQILTGTCLHVGDIPTPSHQEVHRGTVSPKPGRVLPEMPGALGSTSSTGQGSHSKVTGLHLRLAGGVSGESKGKARSARTSLSRNRQPQGLAVVRILRLLCVALDELLFSLSLSFFGSRRQQLYIGTAAD